MILLQAIYSLLLFFRVPITGSHQWDGILAVLIGLYACTHPAANVIDLLFYDRGEMFRGSSRTLLYAWWVLNLLVLLAGWNVISAGLLRFTAVR